jgi:hypothetical protein
MISEARRTSETQSRTVMPYAGFNKKLFFASKPDLKLRKKPINCYIRSFVFAMAKAESNKKKKSLFYQQIGLTFEEETSKILHLEHVFVWC